MSNQNERANMSTTYSIHESSTGNTLCKITVEDVTEIENLSGDNSEGHFLAGQSNDIIASGVDPFLSVYAIIH